MVDYFFQRQHGEQPGKHRWPTGDNIHDSQVCVGVGVAVCVCFCCLRVCWWVGTGAANVVTRLIQEAGFGFHGLKDSIMSDPFCIFGTFVS